MARPRLPVRTGRCSERFVSGSATLGACRDRSCGQQRVRIHDRGVAVILGEIGATLAAGIDRAVCLILYKPDGQGREKMTEP